MFKWYRDAQVCYVYLSDVDTRHERIGIDLQFSIDLQFRESQWFTRGWTLQELLAPEALEFFDKNWTEIGTKNSLQARITKATGIKHLFNFQEACVATKMSWASKRQTTRVEDQAYCLMGLFGVNMPPLYGEGENAFLRLQLEILSKTDDESIFAWNNSEHSFLFLDRTRAGLLASSPAQFEASGGVQQKMFDGDRPPFSMTNKGLRLELTLFPREGVVNSKISPYRFVAPLNCTDSESADTNFLAIPLVNWGPGWTRGNKLESWDIKRIGKRLELAEKQTIFVKQSQSSIELPMANSKRPDILMFVVQSLGHAGYMVSRRYFEGSNDHPCWQKEPLKGVIPFLLKDFWIRRAPVALLLKPKEPSDTSNLLTVVVGKSTSNSLWVDAFSTTSQHSLRDITEMAGNKWDGKVGSDRVTRKLANGLTISVSVRKRMASGTEIYVAEILAERGAGPRWLDVGKEQRGLQENI